MLGSLQDHCPCVFEDTPFLSNTCGPTFTLFMWLLESVLRAQCDVAQPCRRVGHSWLDLHEEQFDFVIVGAGVAGPVLASRLSENPHWSVLLLEAGPEEPTATQVPAFAVSGVHTPLDWNYTTVPQQAACLNKGGVCAWPRGKMVSGTGSLHGMMYTRGHRSIYDGWRDLGNKGWGFDDVLPYFKKAERNGNPDEVEPEFHGFYGPLDVQHFPNQPAMAETLVRAGQRLGLRRGDLNGCNQTGINVAQVMVRAGLRASTPSAYLRPVHYRPNLKVATHAHVTKVLIQPDGPEAYGVEFVNRRGRRNVVFARKEVILSAGAVSSPQLLLLSGIGPSEDLEALGIESVKDLPVGHNLRNHVSVGVGFYINDSSTQTLTIDSFNQFVRTRSGPLAGTGLTQLTAFVASKYADDPAVPDLQVFFDGYEASCSRTGQPGECSSGQLGGDCGRRYLHARPTNVRPQSVGALRLASASPLDYPRIDPQYFSEQRDVDVLVEGIKFVLNMSRTPELAAYGMQLDTSVVPGCENLTFASDEYWACVVRRATGPENHQVGTCRMGPAGDAQAVVDPELRVHGVDRLRVVDASVFPWTPNSNPVAAIVMAAEKAADLLKGTWGDSTAADGPW